MALTAVNAQSNPAATTLTDLYTVPASNNAEGRVIAANRAGAGTTIRVSIAPAGAADALSQYIAYDLAIAANAVYESPRIAVTATDVIRVYATLATVSFTFSALRRS